MPDALRVELRIEAPDGGRGAEAAAGRAERGLQGAAAAARRGAAASVELSVESRKLAVLKRNLAAAAEREARSQRGAAAAHVEAAGGLRRLAGYVAGFTLAGAVTAITTQAAQFAAETVRVGTALDSLRAQLDAGVGSAALQGEWRRLREEADRLGLAFRPLAAGYARITAASRGTLLEGRAIEDVFTGITEAAAVLQLDAQALDGVLQAVEQQISKGVISAEELRGQMGERLPGAFQIAARAVGVSTMELDRMLRQGELLAEDFLPRFAAQLRREFGARVPEAAGTARASFNRLGNAIEGLQDSIAQSGLLDYLASAAESASRLIRSLTLEPDALDAPGAVRARIEALEAERDALEADRARSAQAGRANLVADIQLARIGPEIERLTGLLPASIDATIDRLRAEVEALEAGDRSPLGAFESPERALAERRQRLEEAERIRGERQLRIAQGYQAAVLASAARTGEAAAEAAQISPEAAARATKAFESLMTERERLAAENAARVKAILEGSAAGSPEQAEGLRRSGEALAAGLAALAEREAAGRRRAEAEALAAEERRRGLEADARRHTADLIIAEQRERRERELLEAEGFNSEEERIEADHQQRLADIRRQARDAEEQARREAELTEASGLTARQDMEIAHVERVNQIRYRQVPEIGHILTQVAVVEATSGRARAQASLELAQSTFTALGALSGKAFKVAQAAAIAQTIISTITGAQEAFRAGLQIPAPAPIPQIAAATLSAAALAAGYARVQQIRAQSAPQAFQRGGIVDEPTFFAARGLPDGGVAGEAGPEAIIPLRRSPDGRLGVGAPGVNVPITVNVIDESGVRVRASSRRRADGGADVELRITDRDVARAIDRGALTQGALGRRGLGPPLEGR